MCKKSLLMMLLMALFAPWAANAQTTVEIGDGTSAGYYTPIGTYYNYSITEQLYTAEEIGTAGTISSVSFYWAYTTAKDFNITMYMANVDAENLSTGISLADADEVYSGTLSVPATAGWVTITLDTPFAYDGTSNLLIGFNKTGGATWFSGSTWRYTAATNMARYTQNDNSPYDTSTVPGTSTANRPNIQIEITPSGSGPTCTKPSTLEVTDIAGYSATCTWENTGAASYTFEYKATAASDYTVVSGLTANTYALSSLEPMTAYSVRVKAVCGTDLESGYKSATFTTLDVCPDGKVCIGEGTTTNTYLPTYGFYKYSLTQQIYSAEEMGGAGLIESVDFYCTSTLARTMDVYMVSTDKDVFESTTDWIPVTSADLVYSGEVTFAQGWNTITFANPFIFMGRTNVALIVDDNTGGYTSGIPFYVFDAEGNQAIRIYSDGINYDPEAPTQYTGTQMNVKNRVRFGVSELPSCLQPTGLTVSDIEARQAVLSWNQYGEATAWQVEVTGEYTTTWDVTTNPYTLVGLEPETEYTVKVRANCGGGDYSEWSGAVTFTTDVTCHAPTTLAVSDIEAFSANVNWTGTETTYGLRYVANANYVNQGYVTNPGAMADGSDASWLQGSQSTWGSNVNFASGYLMADDFIISTATTLNEIEVYGYQTGSTTTSTFTGLYAVICDGNPADSTTNVVWGDNETNIMTSTAFTNCYRGSNNDPTGMTRPIMAITASNLNIDLEPGTYWLVYGLTGTLSSGPWGVPYCEPNIGVTGAGLQYGNGNWQNLLDSGSGENYGPAMKLTFADDIETLDWTYVNNIEANTYAMTNLEPETPYLVQVRATCGGDDGNSEWATATFTTLPTCLTPTALSVSEIEARQAVLSWTENGDATAWDVEVTGEYTTTWNATTNPYTLVGLEPSTRYTVKVRAKCSDTDFSEWSTEVVFTTDVSCHAPTNLTITDITRSSATVGWTSDNDNFELWYREHVVGGTLTTNFDDSNMNGWTTIDADGDGYIWVLATEAAGVYHNTGVDLTGQGHNSSNDFIVSGSYTNAGAAALTPDNYLVSPQVAFGGSITFWAQAQDASFAAEHFGVAVSTTGNTNAADFTTIQEWTLTAKSRGASDVADNAYNNRTRGGNRDTGAWYEYTVDLSAYSGTGYVAIRHFNCTDQFMLNVDDIVIEQPAAGGPVEWIEVNNATNPYTITGLNPETTYDVKVRSNCGEEDGYSTWLTGSFTTPEGCPAPSALGATPYALSAELSWEGVSESYTVSYRQPGHDEGGLTETFGTSIPTGWTMYTGLLSNVMGGTALTPATYGWSFGTGNNVFDNHARCNIYGTYQRWLVTPAFTLSSSTFTFDMALTVYTSSSSASPTPGNQPDDKFVVLVSTDNMATWTILRQWDNAGSEYVYDSITNDANGEAVSIDLSAYVGQTVRIAFYGESTVSNGDNNLHIDNVLIGNPQTIVEDWQTVTVDEAAATLTGLMPATIYEWKVQGNCGEWGMSEESAIMTFTTTNDACPVPTNLTVNNETLTATTADLSWNGSPDVESFTVRYRAPEHVVGGLSESFDVSGVPAGWMRYSGLVDEVIAGTATLTTTTSGWQTNAYALGTYNMKVNIYGTVAKYWLVSPEVTPTSGTFTFDLALTDYNNSDPIEDPTAQADDRFVVLVYANDAWTILREWNNTGSDYVYNTIATTGEAVSIDLSAYVGQAVKIAFYGESTASGGDNDLHIDNVVIGNPVTIPATDWMTVEGITDMNVTLTGLTPETPYEAQVKADCSEAENPWSNTLNFTTLEQTTVTQTIALSGTTVNYCSFYVDITLADLQTALTDVLGTGNNVSITIKSQTQNTKLTRGRWTGQLTSLDLGKMYLISVNSECEITLEGMLVDPASHVVTIAGGGNPTWIAFPFNTEMTVTDAFAGFAVNGDVIKSKTQNSSYTRGRWNGALQSLVPGQGYIYKSAANAAEREFVYPTNNKK